MTTNETSKTKITTKDVPSDGFKKFQKAMEGYSNDVSRLLNAHLLVEYFIEQIIIVTLKRGDILLTDGHFTFAMKLLIVKSFDIVDSNLLTSLKHLNTVRNRCSHSIDYVITEADIDQMGRPFGMTYQQLKIEHSSDLLKVTLMLMVARLEFFYEKALKLSS